MSEFSDYLEDKLLDITLKNGATYTVATPYLALFTSDPTDAGSGTECSFSGYARQTMSFGTIASGAVSTDATINFPALVGADITVTHIGVYDAATSGNLLYHTILDASKLLQVDDIMSFASGGVTVTLQ
jgi:hypothetical protein